MQVTKRVTGVFSYKIIILMQLFVVDVCKAEKEEADNSM